ncbi:MAG: penicillin-binding protein 2 [Fimbriimonadaceae bacterium]
MSVIHAPKAPEYSVRLVILAGFLLLVVLVLLGRLWFLQVWSSEYLSEKAQRHRTISFETVAPRGLIYDRNGVLLAGVRPEVVVTVIPRMARRDPELLERLALATGTSEETLRQIMERETVQADLPVPIFLGLDPVIAAKLIEEGWDTRGLGIETQPMRYYADSFAPSHVVGYAWTPSEQDVNRLREEGIRPARYVGKVGIEAVYERELMGEMGRDSFEVDAKRRPTRVIGRDNSLAGSRLNLFLDVSLQKKAIELLGGRRGSVVALDPATGGVLVMASSPSYDSSMFLGGITRNAFQGLLDDPDKPLLNRSIHAAYPPASTFKIVTAIAAMQSGKFSLNRPTNCPGYFEIGNRRFRCLGRHGNIAFTEAMAKSCNTYFADLAVKVGPEQLHKTARQMGLGEKTGIDLVGERSGVVPDEEWRNQHRREVPWRVGDTVNNGIGQGDLSVTPLQMATLVALVANGGRAPAPRIVDTIEPRIAGLPIKSTKPSHFVEVDLTGDQWSTIRRSLFEVVQTGTARAFRSDEVSIAGKTGTAENRRDREAHSWFVGYAPANNPKIAIAVIVENAGHGSEAAAPIAASLIRSYLLSPSSSPNSRLASSADSRPASTGN